MNTPRLIVMPGASLLELTPVAGGLRVRCPGCLAVQVFADDVTKPTAFVHGDNCPVLRKIENTMRIYERTTVRRG